MLKYLILYINDVMERITIFRKYIKTVFVFFNNTIVILTDIITSTVGDYFGILMGVFKLL